MSTGCYIICWQIEFINFLKDFIYVFMKDTEREAETQAEGDAGCLWGARCGAPSQDPGITP